jgi:nitrate reductase gamma subunit
VAVGYLTGNRATFEKFAAVIGVIAAVLTFIVKSYQEFLEDKTVRTKIRTVEAQIRENPEKPQLAWELAQTKLESYLNRNLGQVRSIFWLTVIVMLVGFAFILFGVVRAFDAPDKLPVAIVASASGVLISFIGGSFLIVYRSTLAQSKDYVSVLERINAVGMAVQVLETIPESSAELKHVTTAEVAKQLLRLYSTPAPKESTRKKGS